jgi:hypothetical protein
MRAAVLHGVVPDADLLGLVVCGRGRRLRGYGRFKIENRISSCRKWMVIVAHKHALARDGDVVVDVLKQLLIRT